MPKIWISKKLMACVALPLLALNICLAVDGVPTDNTTMKGKVFIGTIRNKYDPSKILFIDVGTKDAVALVFADAVTSKFAPTLDIVRQPDPLPTENLESKYSSYKIGDRVLVQCFENPTSDSPARVTTNLGLVSRDLVLCYPMTGVAISKTLTEQIRGWAMTVSIPKGCGLIVRKSASQSAVDDLNQQLDGLMHRMENILRSATIEVPPKLLDE
jgi:Ribonuclease G/E